MAVVNDIYEKLKEFAPLELKMSFDNPGFLVGRGEQEVKNILIALDITDSVIEEAKNSGIDLIVSHHPLFFEIKTVTDESPIGRKIVNLIESGISAICMHTNLDTARGGVNDVLAEAVGIEKPEYLTVDGYDSKGEAYGMARYGFLKEPTEMSLFLKRVKNALSANGLRYYDAGKPVYKVAVLGGSGGSELEKAIEAGCDTYITADVKYNVFLDASEAGINLIDGGHFNTENLVCEKLLEVIRENFTDINAQISKVHRQTECFYM